MTPGGITTIEVLLTQAAIHYAYSDLPFQTISMIESAKWGGETIDSILKPSSAAANRVPHSSLVLSLAFSAIFTIKSFALHD